MKNIAIAIINVAVAGLTGLASVAHAGPNERFQTQEAALADAHESAQHTARAFGSRMRSALVCDTRGGGGRAVAYVTSLSMPRDIVAVRLYKVSGGGHSWRNVDPTGLTNCVVAAEKLD